MMASISGFVWQDTNGNGVREVSEGVASVTVRLHIQERPQPEPDTVIAVSATDLSGAYAFTDLDAGIFAVSVVPPASKVMFDNEPEKHTVTLLSSLGEDAIHDFRLTDA